MECGHISIHVDIGISQTNLSCSNDVASEHIIKDNKKWVPRPDTRQFTYTCNHRGAVENGNQTRWRHRCGRDNWGNCTVFIVPSMQCHYCVGVIVLVITSKWACSCRLYCSGSFFMTKLYLVLDTVSYVLGVFLYRLSSKYFDCSLCHNPKTTTKLVF